MALYTETKALERIVKERARQLRREGSGYIAAVNMIVDELYRGAHGEVTPIVVMGLGAKVPLNEILRIIGRLLSFLHDLWTLETVGIWERQGARRAGTTPSACLSLDLRCIPFVSM